MEQEKAMLINDNFFSKEAFTLIFDPDYQLWKTTPVPLALDTYYQSNNYLSHSKQNSAIGLLYHWIKQWQLRKKIALANKFNPKKGKLLDVGCGIGDFVATAKANYWEALGVEPSKKAREHASNKGLTVLSSLPEEENGCFAVITLWHVLEHLPDPKEALRSYFRLLESNGFLFLATPNYKSYDAKHYGTFWAGWDVPRHLWHFSSHSIQRLGEEVGFTYLKRIPMKFDSFYLSLLSEKYKTGHPNLWSAFSVGLKSNRAAEKTGEYSSHIHVMQKKAF